MQGHGEVPAPWLCDGLQSLRASSNSTPSIRQRLSPGQPWPMTGHSRKLAPGHSVQQGTPRCPGAPCGDAETSSELHGCLRLLLSNLPFSHLSFHRCQTWAWPGDLCPLSTAGAISNASFALPLPLAHLLPGGPVTQERLQRLTDSRGPTASHGQVFSASLGVHSCEIAGFVFFLPPFLWLRGGGPG